jgi:tetratricopeptide (TPR) repeat protein
VAAALGDEGAPAEEGGEQPLAWDEDEDLAVVCIELAEVHLSLHPDDFRAWMSYARVAVAAFMYDEAEDGLGQASRCATDDQRHEVWLVRGNLAHQRGACREAVRWLIKALRAWPDLAAVWATLGQVMATLQRPRWAARAFVRASELEPDNGEHHLQHGLTLRTLGEHRHAACALRAALSRELDPEQVKAAQAALQDVEIVAALIVLGEVPYARQREALVQRVRVAAEQSLLATLSWLMATGGRCEDDPELVHWYAAALWGLNRCYQAVAYCEGALQQGLEPDQENITRHLLSLINGEGLRDFQTSVRWSDEVLRNLNPRMDGFPTFQQFAITGAGNGRVVAGRLDEAIAYGRCAVEDPDATAETWFSLGAWLSLARDYEGALAACQRAWQLDPDDPGYEPWVEGLGYVIALRRELA